LNKANAGGKLPQTAGSATDTSKIKVEGLRRKKRRMKLKAKGGNGDQIIEKFTAQSSKSAKYAKTTVKKREGTANIMQGGDVKENKAEGEGGSSVTGNNAGASNTTGN
jgi:hypothetical protein